MAAGVDPPLDQRDRALLTLAQASFPLVSRPFAMLGHAVGADEAEALDRLLALRQAGLLRRIAPVFEPAALGLVTELLALRVDAGHLEHAADTIAGWPQVTHCYERDHAVNLWVAGEAAAAAWFTRRVREMAAWPGVQGVWRLPTVRRFKIGVCFDLVGEGLSAPVPALRPAAGSLGEKDRALLGLLETDLPLCPKPFEVLAARAGLTEHEVLSLLIGWHGMGRIRRYGALVSHRRLGFVANAMTVWRVPPGRLVAAGEALAASPAVSHCYERPPFADFPYNLYAMVHGRSRPEVLELVDKLGRSAGLPPGLPLFSTREFKKTSPSCAALLAAADSQQAGDL